MKKIMIGLALIATAGAFTACDGFLEEEPLMKQSNELTYANFDGLNQAGAALYSRMQSATWYDGQFVLQSELRGGNAKNPLSIPGSGRYRQDTQWNYSANNTSSLWTHAYYTISWANNIINNLPSCDMGKATEQDANNLKAEALFVRALCHFDLVITYAQSYKCGTNNPGVPVILKTENGQPARNTVGEVYDQIVNDLLEAESLMDDKYVRSGVDDAAATCTKPAIQALLSRVYLYMENWQGAADYATKVINNSKYSLAEGDAYLGMFSAATAPKGEIIFEVYGSKKNDYWDESGWTHLPYITSWGDGNDGSGDVCATTDLVDMYEASDVRLKLFTKNENDNLITKYAGKAGSIPRETNVPILRLSEMYLNRAEAISKGASVSGASARGDLETIASKRGATVPAQFNVLDERRKELMFEGHIVYDLARTQTALKRTDFDGTVNKDIPAAPDYRWAMPIPKRELDANRNMTQNEGY
jgi:hypothetical protein